MSGMGSSGGAASLVLDCNTLSFNTDINSPQKNEVDKLEVNDKLNVVLIDGTVSIVQPLDQNIIGSINWSSIVKLIECIRDGHEFVATVRDIQGGLVKINISAK